MSPNRTLKYAFGIGLIAYALAVKPLLTYADDKPEKDIRQRYVNIRIQPIGAILGEYLFDLSVAPLKWLSVGAIGYSANVDISESKAVGQGMGARCAVFFSAERYSDSWFLSSYYYQTGKINLSSPSIFSGTALTGSSPGASEFGLIIGKQWIWNSGFSMSFAGGYRKLIYRSSPITLSNPSGSDTTTFNPSGEGAKLEYTIGWAF